MTESIITISLVGLVTGFIFSMPIAGPISILVTSNALKGKLRYCNLVTAGASFADFIYVFIAVFGLTKLYVHYKPAIPYILIAGAIFLLILGYRVIKTRLDLEHLDEKIHLSKAIKKKGNGGFYTGFMVNFLNPTLFLGWLTSSFFVITLAASLGLNTGGLDNSIDRSVQEMNTVEGKKMDKPDMLSRFSFDSVQIQKQETNQQEAVTYPKHFHLLISLSYAFFLSMGSIIWFYLLALFIGRFRMHINIKILNALINSLGVVLCFFGAYLGYKGVLMLIAIFSH
jgi:threonine/homoserine/homoserine lactone efflux protein